MTRVVAVVGPTAVGKTALGVHIGELLGGEIVSADSRQIYRRMDIGTAKPTPDELARVRHWLVDVAEPDETFGLGQFVQAAGDALQHIWSRGGQALLVGGTGQYVWALLEGWRVPRVPPNWPLRRELERESSEALFRELERIDPESAEAIDARNVRRVIRAIEVYRATGRPLSEWRTRQRPEFEALVIGLSCQRDELYRRIDVRVERMMAAGFLDEVRSLLEAGYSADLPSMSGIGYRQLCQYLKGEMPLVEAVERIKTESHRLARMQHTWFRQDDERIRWLDATDEIPIEEGLRLAKEFLAA